MKVTLIARTRLETEGIDRAGVLYDLAPEWRPVGPVQDADALVEFGGRSCYQSWSNPSGRDNKAYIGNIIQQGHFSVLEHASASFYIEGVSRSLTHELVRHRHFSFSQLSQRFVNLGDSGYVIPPALRDLLDEETGKTLTSEQGRTVRETLDRAFDEALSAYERLAGLLEAKGLPRKQAREAARAVLPNMVETSIVVTGNHRSWREFIQKRFSVHADAEIRELAGLLLPELRSIAPSIYQDIQEEAYE